MDQRKSFFKTEDFWAITVGAFFLLASLGIFLSLAGWPIFDGERPSYPTSIRNTIEHFEKQLAEESAKPVKTLAWHEAQLVLERTNLSGHPVGKTMRRLTAKPNGWTTDPLVAFHKPANETAQVDNQAQYDKAKSADSLAAQSGYQNPEHNARLASALDEFRVVVSKAKKSTPGDFSLLKMALFFMLVLLVFGFGAHMQGTPFRQFAAGFPFVFLLSLVALFFAAQKDLKDLGVEYAVWAIVLGMLISNTVGTPKWVVPALKTEFFIKTGLIVMGAEVLFNKMLTIGVPGLFVAWVVTPIVLISTFWFGQRVLKIASKSLNITISADMSVCGVSAAVAVAAASRATREELTVAVGLSMIFTAIMMVVMPLFVKFMDMPEVLGGAWIGGTIDSSGAVVAAGAALGDKAMYVAATIKMIQNVLIGFVAFGVAVYFATKVDGAAGQRVGVGEIWRRFPKFILGFVGASLLFTAIHASLGGNLAAAVIEGGVLDVTKNLRTWLFCLAFASIGLSTNFRELRGHFTGGKPLLLYICGQTLNILLTLGMAYLMFCVIFPEVADKI